MALLHQPDDSIELTFIRKAISKTLADTHAMGLHHAEISTYYQNFLRGMVYTLRADVLADHLENQTVQYVETTLPRWLKWLQRFVVEREYKISLDAYYTYPEARIKIPNLGEARKQITFSKTRLPRFI